MRLRAATRRPPARPGSETSRSTAPVMASWTVTVGGSDADATSTGLVVLRHEDALDARVAAARVSSEPATEAARRVRRVERRPAARTKLTSGFSSGMRCTRLRLARS